LAKSICKYIGGDHTKLDSIILYHPGVAYYYKSSAALEIAEDLGGIYSLISIFKIFPEKFRNFIYDHIAKNRYKWYGKKESCMIPTPELKAKFL
jgi:predicted DCC family thiol-disulfide oxidoreductase YuxK